MPASSSSNTTTTAAASQQKSGNKATELLKFEVSSPDVFRFVFTTTKQAVSFDVGAGSLQKSIKVPIPEFVQSTAASAYSFALPYAKWAGDKAVALTSSGKSE